MNYVCVCVCVSVCVCTCIYAYVLKMLEMCMHLCQRGFRHILCSAYYHPSSMRGTHPKKILSHVKPNFGALYIKAVSPSTLPGALMG